MWTLDEALPLIRKISDAARSCKFSVALYGSVLEQAESSRDLDLFFVKQDPACNVELCRNEIRKLPEVRHFGHCVIWLVDGRHIDAQFLLDSLTARGTERPALRNSVGFCLAFSAASRRFAWAFVSPRAFTFRPCSKQWARCPPETAWRVIRAHFRQYVSVTRLKRRRDDALKNGSSTGNPKELWAK
jgi:hypothetical protein